MRVYPQVCAHLSTLKHTCPYASTRRRFARKVSVLLEKSFGLIDYTAGEMMYRETDLLFDLKINVSITNYCRKYKEKRKKFYLCVREQRRPLCFYCQCCLASPLLRIQCHLVELDTLHRRPRIYAGDCPISLVLCIVFVPLQKKKKKKNCDKDNDPYIFLINYFYFMISKRINSDQYVADVCVYLRLLELQKEKKKEKTNQIVYKNYELLEKINRERGEYLDADSNLSTPNILLRFPRRCRQRFLLIERRFVVRLKISIVKRNCAHLSCRSPPLKDFPGNGSKKLDKNINGYIKVAK
ncbi:hypothetical protein PUN28_019256 [Cardiocondyla obscurior]|uniref:Uncharacterized protein n=1 Tax=Cardiocondyla obscurior TaxID=286306 RepID=A0AAW2EDE6_9HYME